MNVHTIDIGEYLGPLVDNYVLGDLTVSGECPMYRYRLPQGPWLTTMYRETLRPLVNVPCIDVGAVDIV